MQINDPCRVDWLDYINQLPSTAALYQNYNLKMIGYNKSRL